MERRERDEYPNRGKAFLRNHTKRGKQRIVTSLGCDEEQPLEHLMKHKNIQQHNIFS